VTDLSVDGLILIILCVFLGWAVSALVLDRWQWLRNKGPTVYGTRTRLVLTGVLIWTVAVGISAMLLVLASVLFPGITVLAILFGLQAMLLDYCSRVRYRSPSASSGHRNLSPSPTASR
jgi:hypothetical protein